MSKQTQPKNFTFKMVKQPDFRTVNIDGFMGGLTIKRTVNINFFVDASDLPKNIVHNVVSHNRIGDQQQEPQNLNPSAVRELPFGVNIDVPTAKLLVIWLNERIQEADSLIASLSDIEKQENLQKFD